MMYSEFIELANIPEDKLTYKTYSEVIEPMYMNTNLSKQDFVKLININTLVENYDNPYSVKKTIVKEFSQGIKNISLIEKLFELDNYSKIKTITIDPSLNLIRVRTVSDADFIVEVSNKVSIIRQP